jgi:glycerol uptake facilitator-like aquaporin
MRPRPSVAPDGSMKYVAEVIGTFFLAITVGTVAASANPLEPWVSVRS